MQAGVVAPNKHTSAQEPQYKGKLLESETYIGGKVEAIESGVFRSDIPTRFKCRSPAYQVLIENPLNLTTTKRIEDRLASREGRGQLAWAHVRACPV